ncbi:hypothetical protein B5P43_14055 [Bacillus sp. SRB_336]|nr:hypothetical protein B5P43_14055 [Bacillus sp. SRB_336]
MDCMSDPFALPSADAADPALQEAIRDVEKQFGIMIVKTRKSILSRAAAIHAELQPMGFKVLTVLSQSGPIQQVALAHKVDADKAAMSRAIKQLEALGLVERAPDPSDGRAHLVAMTGEARIRFDATQSQARKVLYDRLAAWDAGEVRRFADLLDRLNTSTD